MHTPPDVTPSIRRSLVTWWAYLVLATTLLALVIAQRYFIVAELDESPAIWAFRILMLIAHFAALSSLLLFPVLIVAWLWPKPRAVVPLGITVSAVILIALLVDTQVYQLYRFHINAGVMNLLLGGAASETFIFSRVMYVQAVLIVAAIVTVLTVLGSWCWRHTLRQPQRKWFSRPVAATLSVAIVSFHSIHIYADLLAYEPLLEQTQILPLRYAATAKRSLQALGVPVREGSHALVAQKNDRSPVRYPLKPLQCEAPRKPPNIVVVMIDSWRFDAMSAAITPNIDAFADRAVRFTDHYSGGNATRIGVFSFFYSIPGTYWHSLLVDKKGPVFVDELLKRDYDVNVFRSAPLHSPEFHRTVFAQLNEPRMRSDGADPAEWDRDLTDDFLSFLNSRDSKKPFFSFLFYDAPHNFILAKDHPVVFEPIAEEVNYFALNNDTDKTPLLNRYWNSLNYVDSLIGEVLSSLEDRALLDDTVVIITGDHGQEFNDNGRNYWGHSSNFSRYQTGVPFVFYAPRVQPAVVSHRTTHFDVVPTLLHDYFGCAETPSNYSVGRSLFEPGGREALVLSEYADFAIAENDRIAVVRKHGMTVHGPGYAELPGHLDASTIRSALEQKTRFYRGAPRISRAK